LPTVLGEGRVGGRFLYTTPPRRVAGQVSGKGGQPKQERDTFIVDAMAHALTYGEPVKLDELYLNGQLVYAPNSLNSLVQAQSAQFAADHLTFFAGDPAQTPSTLLESFSGVGNVPAFNSMSYVVLRALNLGDYGNSYPQVVAKVSSVANYSNAKLFLERALELSGINIDSQEAFGVDVLNIDQSVASIPFIGSIFTNSGNNIQSWIESFIELYQLVLEETADGIFSLKQPYDVTADVQNVVTVDALETLGVDGGDRYSLVNNTKDTVPSSVSLTYVDPLREMDENSATVYNTKAFETNDISVNIPYALSRSQAYTGCERIMRAAWSRKQTLTFSLPITGDFFLRVGELVRFLNEPTLEGSNWVVVEQTFSTKFFVEYTCVQLNRILYAYNKNVLGSLFGRPTADSPFDVQSSLVFDIIDTPLINASDNQREGLYVAFEIPNTTSAVDVYISCDNGITFNNIGTINNSTITGNLLSPLPTGDPHISDELSLVNVQLTDSTKALISVSEAEYLLNEQILHVNGEYISYRDATPLGNGVFQLSGITRGVENTEHAVQAHSSGSFLSFLAGDSTSRPRIDMNPNDVGTKLFKLLVVGNNDLDGAISQTLNYEANSSKSLAPIEEQPLLSGSDWIISYVDRSITDSARNLQNGLPLPANIDGNLFEIELFDDGTLIKSVFVNGNSFTYTAAEQTADTGGLVTNLTFNVYQHRTTLPVGRGFESLNVYN